MSELPITVKIKGESCGNTSFDHDGTSTLKIDIDESRDVYVSILDKRYGLVSLRFCSSGMPKTWHTRQALMKLVEAIELDNAS